MVREKSFLIRKRTLRIDNHGGGVGNLTNCPFYFLSYICARCKNQYSFITFLKCTCETLHKYKAKPIYVNNIYFDSLSEGVRYSKLVFLEKRGIIKDLELHPKFNLDICVYEADFKYTFEEKVVIEEVKGKLTDVSRLKLKLMKKLYPDIEITLVWV